VRDKRGDEAKYDHIRCVYMYENVIMKLIILYD
jgi:hypothetical protein